jgi:hypothetical protein
MSASGNKLLGNCILMAFLAVVTMLGVATMRGDFGPEIRTGFLVFFGVR